MQFTLNKLQGGRVHSEEEDSDIIMDDLEEDDDEDRLNVWVMVILADSGQCAIYSLHGGRVH